MNLSTTLLLVLYFVVASRGDDTYADWTCNHYGSYTVDVCYQLSSNTQQMYQCNGTNAINLHFYTDGSCVNSSYGTPAYTLTLNKSDDTDDQFDCSQSLACDYAILRLYFDEDCNGNAYVDEPYIIDQCYHDTDSGTSYMYTSCTESLLENKTYTSSDDCTGTRIISYHDYEDLGYQSSSDETLCYEWMCGMEEVAYGNIGPFNCNVSLWDTWPILEGTCSYITNGSDSGSISVMTECSSDRSYATMTTYQSDDCDDDTIMNITNATYFYCGAIDDGNCSAVTFKGRNYNGSNDCSGDTIQEMRIIVAQIGYCFDLGYASLSINVSDDEILMSFWADDDCSNVNGSFLDISLEDGCDSNTTSISSTHISLKDYFSESDYVGSNYWFLFAMACLVFVGCCCLGIICSACAPKQE